MSHIPGKTVEYGLQTCLTNALRGVNGACAEICTEIYDEKEVVDYVFEITIWSMLLTITRAEDDMTLHDLHFFSKNFANNSLNLCWISKDLHSKKSQFVDEFLKYHSPEENEKKTPKKPQVDYSEIRNYLRSRSADVSNLLTCLPAGVKETALSIWKALCTFGEHLMLTINISSYYDDTSDMQAVDEVINQKRPKPLLSLSNNNNRPLLNPDPSRQLRHSAPPYGIRTTSRTMPRQNGRTQTRRAVSFEEQSKVKSKIAWPFNRHSSKGASSR